MTIKINIDCGDSDENFTHNRSYLVGDVQCSLCADMMFVRSELRRDHFQEIKFTRPASIKTLPCSSEIGSITLISQYLGRELPH